MSIRMTKVPEGAAAPAEELSWLPQEKRCQAAVQQPNLLWRQCFQYRFRWNLFCWQHRRTP